MSHSSHAPRRPRRRSRRSGTKVLLVGLSATLLSACWVPAQDAGPEAPVEDAAAVAADAAAPGSTGGAAPVEETAPAPPPVEPAPETAEAPPPAPGTAADEVAPDEAAADEAAPGGVAASRPHPSTVAGGPFVAYSEDSFFRTPLPDNTPVSPQNAQAIAFAQANEPFDYLKIRGAQGVGWGIAYAMADCSDPVWTLADGGNLPPGQEHLRTVGFHAPASLWESIPVNDDAPFLVIDTCGTSARPAGLSVWGANTATAGGNRIITSAAGSFDHASNGLDSRNPLSDTDNNARSRGVIPDSMAIRLDLLDWAIRNGTGLGHVLEVFWLETDSAAGFAHPMIGAEGGKSGFGAEGQRFRIRADIDLASRPGCDPRTNPVGLAIARTLQQHGAYIGDNSGSGSGIKTEQGANYPGLTADSLQGCMTWDDIEFLPLGWDG